MAIPTTRKLYPIILKVLSDGNEYSNKELDDIIIFYLDLTYNEIEMRLPSGKSVIKNRLELAKRHLKEIGLIESRKRGFVNITERGLVKFSENPNLVGEDLMKYASFEESARHDERQYTINTRQIMGKIEYILKNYIRISLNEPISGNPMANLIRTELPENFYNLMGDFHDYKIKGSVGIGNWAKVPRIAFLNKKVTLTFKEGYYVSYLFKEDMSGFYLSLMFGRDNFKKYYGTKNIVKITERIREFIRDKFPQTRHFAPMHLGPENANRISRVSLNYELADIFNIEYSSYNLPSEDKLIDDLKFLLNIYEYVYENRIIELAIDSEIKNRGGADDEEKFDKYLVGISRDDEFELGQNVENSSKKDNPQSSNYDDITDSKLYNDTVDKLAKDYLNWLYHKGLKRYNGDMEKLVIDYLNRKNQRGKNWFDEEMDILMENHLKDPSNYVVKIKDVEREITDQLTSAGHSVSDFPLAKPDERIKNNVVISEIESSPNKYYNFRSHSNSFQRISDLLSRENYQKLERFDFSEYQFKEIIENISKTHNEILDDLIEKNAINFDDLSVLEKMFLFSKSFVKTKYKSVEGNRGFYQFNEIYIDDRQETAYKITTIIHELSHFLLSEILEQTASEILDTDKTDILEAFIFYTLANDSDFTLIDEYCAHTVEGRYTLLGYQNYDSYIKSLNYEHNYEISYLKTVGNTFANYIKIIMKSFIDESLKDEIIREFSNLKDDKKFDGLQFETDEYLEWEDFKEFIKFILTTNFDLNMKDSDDIYDYSNKFGENNS